MDTLNKQIDRFAKLKPDNSPLNKIKDSDVNYSVFLEEQLMDFSVYYINDQWEFDEEAFINHVESDFPGWTALTETIKRFHSNFELVIDYEAIKEMFKKII